MIVAGAPHIVSAKPPASDRRILFSVTVHYPDPTLIPALLAVALAAILLFSRNPNHFLHPELWAEDGTVWIRDAYTYGMASLFWQETGYLQSFSRLIALSALHLNFAAIPLYFVIVSFIVQLVPVALLFSSRAATLIPSNLLRLILAIYYIGEPNSFEVYLNLTNAMWHLALAAFLITILPRPQSPLLQGLELLVLVLSGLSGPLVMFILPIAWWQAIRNRNAAEFVLCLVYAGVVSLCAMVQAGYLLTHNAQRIGNLGASIARFVHIIADQLILGGMIGAGNVAWVCQQPFWQSALLPSLICLAAMCIVGAAFRYGPVAYRQFCVFCAAIMASALMTPVVSFSNQWQAMQYPGAGDRYYVMPMLAWFLSILVLVNKSGRRWLFLPVLGLFSIGVVADWRYADLPATTYQAAAAKFQSSPPGMAVTFPEDPAPWKFTLVKK